MQVLALQLLTDFVSVLPHSILLQQTGSQFNHDNASEAASGAKTHVRTAAGAVELRNTLVSQFGVELPATATFDYPTVTALAGFIASQGALPAAAETATLPEDGVFDEEPPAADAEGARGHPAPAAVDIESIRCIPIRLLPSSGISPLYRIRARESAKPGAYA